MQMRDQNNGFGTLEVVIASVVLAIVTVGIISMQSRAFKAQKSIEVRADRAELRRLLMNDIDCAGTFATAVIDPNSPGVNCNSSSAAGGQVAPFIRLRRKTVNGSTQYLTGPLNGSGYASYGEWKVRASCSVAEQTLVIRAARLDESGNPMKDPLNGQIADWDHPAGLLVGTPGPFNNSPLCFTAAPAGPPIVVNTPLSPSNPGAGGDCRSFLENAVRLYLLVTAPAYLLAIPAKRVYTATASCAAGKKVVSGGAQCGSGFSGLSFLTGATSPGHLIASQPNATGDAWSVACCIEGSGATTNAYAVCQ